MNRQRKCTCPSVDPLRRLILMMIVAGLGHVPSHASEQDAATTFLQTYCVDCHRGAEAEGNLRLDSTKEMGPVNGRTWTDVYEVVRDGEMPPSDALQPSREARHAFLTRTEEQVAEERNKLSGNRRRLNRREFSAALQNITGLPIDFAGGLPGDGLVDGFDTGASALQDSADLVAQHLETTRRAVESIRFLDPDPRQKLVIDFREHEFTDFRKFVDQRWKDLGVFTKSKRLTCRKGVGIYLPTQWTGDRGSSFLAVPAPNDKHATLQLKLRVTAQRTMEGLPTPTLWVSIGDKYIDYVSIDERSRDLEYAIRMEDHVVEGGVIKVMLRSFVEMPYAIDGFENDDRSKPEDNLPNGIGVYRPKFDRKKLRTPDVQPVPSIIVEKLELDYDHVASWPPPSMSRDLAATEDSPQSAERLLGLWMEHAYRRPVRSDEVRRFMDLYEQLRVGGATFDQALRAAFQSVLMSGDFRYLRSPSAGPKSESNSVDEFALASRLSFVFTGGPPDRELLELAMAGKLSDADVLDEQVDRLLSDPRSIAFFRPFVTQWLSMDQPITLVMDHLKQQDFRFGRHLKASMKEETVQYVRQLVLDNRPAAELVDSDWTMMNDILAVHYGADSLEGAQLRKVTWDSKSWDQRGGGILSHAGIQSMLCWMGDNWVIYRGSWALDRVLDDPPPAPPLEVPELNPADKANHGKTFREMLRAHQADPNCSVCHRAMDPLGFAFQNFDVSGRWRDQEHARYRRNELDGKIEWRGEGATRPVDAAGALPHGEAFSSFAEFKQQLTAHYQEPIVRGFLKKLTLYGTGRQADVVDLAAIDVIMEQHAESGYPMMDLVKSWVQSEVFFQ